MLKRSKFLISVLFIISALFALSIAVSADYTTDGDDSTAVDYIIMHADDIKLSTGTKGTLTYDENDYKVVRITPSESHAADESHRLYFTPANSTAGFSASGENSFFDFHYYVVYYKTTANAKTTVDVNFYNGTIFKFAGSNSHSVTSSTVYKAGLIELETFTSGNTTTHTTYPEVSWTNQQMTFKVFPSGDIDGYMDIEAIAAFRTREQANDFMASYTPKSHNYRTDNNDSTTLDYVIMNADDIKLSTGDKGEVITDENYYEVVRITPEESNSSDESHRLYFTPANSTAGFSDSGENSFFDFHYYVVYYRTTSTANATVDVNFYNGSIFKFAGSHSVTSSTDYKAGLIELETFTSGNTTTHTTYPEVSWTNQQMTFKVFPSGNVEGYMDIEAVAAFRTLDQANYFMEKYTPEQHIPAPAYTTDNNDETTLDYVILDAGKVKLATGADGALTTDSDGVEAVLVTPAESYKSPEGGMLSIRPADANVGITDTGDNSLFDFGHYVIRYKTSSTALDTDTVLLGADTHYKWGGSEQIIRSTEYTMKTIARDTYTSGSVTTHTTALDSSLSDQKICLKMFSDAESDGAMYIEEIAIFRTAEQAADYVDNYDTYKALRENETEYLILDSSELSSVAECTQFETSVILGDDTQNGFVKFTATEDGTHIDRKYFKLNFKKLGLTNSITVKEYPVVKIGYKSNITNSGAVNDFNVEVNYLSSSTILWGKPQSFTKDEALNYITFDMSTYNFTGGSTIPTDQVYSYDSIDDNSTYNSFFFKPFYNGAIAKGDYFAVEYIGFFKTAEDANAYNHKIDRTLKEIITEYDVYKLRPEKTLLNTVTLNPIFADVGSVTFESSNNAVATVDSDGLITAVSEGSAVITVIDTESGITKKTNIYVEEPAPIDWYAIDSESGDSMTLNVIGDSISAGDDNTRYHALWASDFKMTVNNWSRGGSAVTGNLLYADGQLETFVPRMERMITHDVGSYDVVRNEENPDMIVVFGGTNDYNGMWQLGKVGDRTRDTFCGALSELIMMAWENYPEAKLVFFTPIKRCDYTATTGQDNTGLRGYLLEDYVKAMIEVCEYYDVPCINLYDNEQVNLIGKRVDYITDGVHMSAEGHRIFAKVTVEEMVNAGVITTHDYTAEPGATYTLDANRDLTAESHIYDAATLDSLATYASGTLLDRQRISKHTLSDEYITFTPETLTSPIAPTVTVDFSKLDFAVTDYPYMSVVYETNSTAEAVNAVLRGNDNHLSALDTSLLPALTSGKRAAFTVNVKDYSTDDINLTGDTINSDLYMTLAFFDSTESMTSESYLSIAYIAFFKTEEAASAFTLEKTRVITYGDVNGDESVNLLDMIILSRYLGNWTGYDDTKIVKYNCDLNNDGAVDGLDVIVIARHLAKWSGYSTLPCSVG